MTEQSIKPKLKDEFLNELGYFELFFSKEIQELFADESATFFRKKLIDSYGVDYKTTVLGSYGKGNNMPYLFVSKGISKEDILAYIAIRVYMDLHRLADIKSYWNSGTPYIKITNIMSKNYFFLIAKAFHFPEKEKDPNDTSECTKNYDSNFKIGPKNQIILYYGKLCQNFQKYYELGDNITIDESTTHFNVKKKPNNSIKVSKQGYRIHLLSDSNTSYLYNMIFEQGKNTDFQPTAQNSIINENVILKLLSCLSDKKKRNLFVDEYYSSPNLLKRLKEIEYLNTSVLSQNSKEDDKSINSIKTNSDSKSSKSKGNIPFDYDLEVESNRKTNAWYPKVIFFGVEACMINAKYLYEKKTGKSLSLTDFKEKVCKQIFNMYKEYNKSHPEMGEPGKKNAKKP